MSQRRQFAFAPSRVFERGAPYVRPRSAGAALDRNGPGAAPQIALEAFQTVSGSSAKTAARRSSAFAHVGFSLAAAVSDALVIVMASAVADPSYRLLFNLPGGVISMASVGCIVAALFVLPNATSLQYRVENYLHLSGHLSRLAALWLAAFLCILAIGFVAKVTGAYSRGAMIVFFWVGFVALGCVRIGLVHFLQRHARSGSILSRRVVVVGYTNDIDAFRTRYEGGMLGMEIVGAFTLHGNGRMARDLELAVSLARTLRPDDVFIAAPWSNKKAIDACVETFRRLPAAIHLGPEPVLARFAHAQISTAGCVPALDLVRRPLSNGEIIAKRLLDVLGASLGLIALAPLFALVAILIRLDSPGPVIFAQRRYGFDREPFRIFKFRSMTTMEDGPHVVQACKDDVRVTRVGRWLRRSNIDELPQLVNVLRGDMSLVGPRPHASAHDDLYEKAVELYACRHRMKPGITGWAQVNGFRGEIRSRDDICKRIEHDLFYADNWSLSFDLKCIWWTVVSAKSYCNAY